MGADHAATLEGRMNNLKGWRTLAVGLLMVIAPPALGYLANVDWNSLVGANGAFVVSGAIMVAMRSITSTSIGQPK